MRIIRVRPFPTCLFLLLLLLGGFLAEKLRQTLQQDLEAMAPALFGKLILIDAGHGGFDPGVLGTAGSREAEINLSVAKKLEEYCMQGGMTVLMSRSGDMALAGSKRADLEARVLLAETVDLFISLHCNSYLGSSLQQGAQVFYRQDNAAAQLLAEGIQHRLRQELGNTERSALPHPNSYLLKQIQAPAVIAELGFLSNPQEEALLQDESYQWKIAWAIYQAVNDFFLLEAANGDPMENPPAGGNLEKTLPLRELQ
ncbi:MAG: N-acetylmuramoyl-L-alanine amidase [Bacillota bacterium]|nr:N-acetylmuramoyl-L-alanine amidase [Bacillota bacterium]